MMQKLTNEPAFWAWLWTFVGLLFTAAAALVGLVVAWAKARTAQYEARTAQTEAKTAQHDAAAAKDTAGAVAVGQGIQQATLVQHTAAIAALQATTQGAGASGGGQGAVPSVVPAAPLPAMPGVPQGVTTGPAAAPAHMTFEQGIGTPSTAESTALAGGPIVPGGG